MAGGLTPLSVAVLLATCCVVTGQLWIDVQQNGSDLNDYSYADASLFSDKYANLGSLEGYLHVPVPQNACSFIEPLPYPPKTSWFALVSDYPSCPEDMVVNVRGAGYTLIITSSNGTGVTNQIRNSGFPLVIVPDWYFELLHNVTSVSFEDPEYLVSAYASLALSVFMVVFLLCTCCFCCCLTVSCCCYCKSRQSRRREEAELFQYRNRQHNYEQIQRRERMARQELIESILRQLQELQVDIRTQTPLGASETNKLPKRSFQQGQSKCDTCAICVEEFNDGEILRWLPCDHCFHPECIDEWLTNHSCLCPLCKTAVPRGGGGAVPVPLLSESTEEDSSLLSTSGSLGRNYQSV